MASSEMVNSLLKAIDILAIVAHTQNGMRLNEIADGLDMKKTTIHNLVRTLRARNYLIKDSINRFRLGPAVQELLLAQQGHSIMREAEAILRNFYKKWPMAKFIFSENYNGEILCRIRISPDQPGFIQHPVSHSLPPYISACSHVLMAFNSEYRSDVVDKFPFETYARHKWKNFEAFLKSIDPIKKQGWANIEYPDKSASLAISVCDRFVLGIHFDDSSEKVVKEAGKELLAAAARLNSVAAVE